MARNVMAKVFAFVALFWVVIGIVWTGLLFFLSSPEQDNVLSEAELQKLIQESSSSLVEDEATLDESASWATVVSWSGIIVE